MIDRYTHIHEDAYYEIGNYSVASSFLFANYVEVKKFKSKVDRYFGGLCDVVCYGFNHEEYRMIIKMHSREKIEAYCHKNYPKLVAKHGFVPETAYVFARAMADLQSSYVKWFNFKYSRMGGLMGGRYHRSLIESESDLDSRINDIHSMTQQFQKTIAWRYKSKLGFSFRSLGKGASSKDQYKAGSGAGSDLKNFKLKVQIYVRHHFNSLPPKRIIWPNIATKIKNITSFFI